MDKEKFDSTSNVILRSHEVLELINAVYSFADGNATQCKFIGRGRNDHYLIGAGSKWYVFRLYLNNKYYIESTEDFLFELELLDHLNSKGIRVSPAIRTNKNELLGITDMRFGGRAFALFNYVKGDEIRLEYFTPALCFELGETIAKFHLAANSFQSQRSRHELNLKWLVDEPLRMIANQNGEASGVFSKDDIEECQQLISSIQPIERLIETVNSLDISGDEFGIIHGDISFSNMHLEGDKITLFDFDHCGYGWRAYDLCLSENLPDMLKAELREGYESVRPLSAGERDCLPIFAKLKELWDIGDSLALMPLLDKGGKQRGRSDGKT